MPVGCLESFVPAGCKKAGQTINCTVPKMDADTTQEFIVQVKALRAGSYRNTATASSDDEDPNHQDNNNDTAVVTVRVSCSRASALQLTLPACPSPACAVDLTAAVHLASLLLLLLQGACCDANAGNTCTDTTEEDCTGTSFNANASCASNPCGSLRPDVLIAPLQAITMNVLEHRDVTITVTAQVWSPSGTVSAKSLTPMTARDVSMVTKAPLIADIQQPLPDGERRSCCGLQQVDAMQHGPHVA